MLDHKYIVFCHLARNPNTTRVAEELLLSQPAISKSIKELEKELGITLFHRIKGRMQLTEAGKYLYEEVESIRKQEREIQFRLDQIRGSFKGTLHLGASTTLSQYILPPILARFTNRHIGISINLISGNTQQIEQAILNDELHLAFIEGTPSQPDIHYIPFLKDEIVLVCATNNKIPETINKKDLSNYNFVFREKGSGTYHVIKKQLAAYNIPINTLNTQLILGTTEGIKQYIQHSECLAFLSIHSIYQELKDKQLRIIETKGLAIERVFHAIHRQGEPDPYAQRFLNFTLSSSNSDQYLKKIRL